MKKITSVICIIFAFIMVLALPVSAATSYQTYTYSISGTALYSPDAYNPALAVDATYIGLKDEALLKKFYPGLSAKDLEAKTTIDNPTDLEVDAEGNVYIADSNNNRILVLDRYYKLKFIIENFINDQGVPDTLTKPQGVFITADKVVGNDVVPGRIFVCDTEANRIVTFTHDGEFLKIIPAPVSELFEEGDVYQPVAVAVDPYDRLYVVSKTTNQGVIVMTDEGEFTGFIGAQKAIINAWTRLLRRFQTEEQREATQSIVPVTFNNITVSGDFIYVTTALIEESKVLSSISGKSKSGDYAPVKMLNAAGDEIMRRNGFYPPSGEVDNKKTGVTDTIFGASTLTDVAVGPEKTWSIVDSKRSKVFTYDFDGNLLFAFGDIGSMLGNISKDGLAAVTYQGDNMLLLDKQESRFTVYERTDYGNILINALHNQNERNYDAAVEDWNEILKRNSNFDAAYIGIGNALYRDHQLTEACEYYEAAYDKQNYSVAYKDIRKEWLASWIWVIPIVVIAICIGCSQFLKFANKVNKKAATSGKKKTFWEELLYVFHVIFHPFDGFWDLKHEKRGSLRAAIVILVMTIVAFYYQAIGQGYLLNTQGIYSTPIDVLLSVIIPLALWVVGNWCLTTLFDGEGNLKDIFIATCYSLMPMVLVIIPTTVMSNFLTLEELEILSVVNTFAFIWTGLLIFLGMMVTHDYTIFKNLLTVIGTIIAMIVIIFIALLFTTLVGKIVNFVTNIVTELSFRM